MFYSLLNDNILDKSRLKTFAGGNINLNKKLKFNLIWEESKKVVGKRENAGYQYISPFLTVSSTGLFIKVDKSRDCVAMG